MQSQATYETCAQGTLIKRSYICSAKLLTAFLGSGKRVPGEAMRSVSAHHHLFASVRLMMNAIVVSSCSGSELEIEVAKKAAKRKITRKEYEASDIKLLKMHSKARTPVSKLAKLMKRSEGSLRQKALKLGIGLGHQR
jgi:hypothetical protein